MHEALILLLSMGYYHLTAAYQLAVLNPHPISVVLKPHRLASWSDITFPVPAQEELTLFCYVEVPSILYVFTPFQHMILCVVLFVLH